MFEYHKNEILEYVEHLEKIIKDQYNDDETDDNDDKWIQTIMLAVYTIWNNYKK